MIRKKQPVFEGVPMPAERGAVHADTRFQLRAVRTGRKRSIEVEDEAQPGETKRIKVPVIEKVDALIWAWDAEQARWLTRLQWEAIYGPPDAPLWVPSEGFWTLEARAPGWARALPARAPIPVAFVGHDPAAWSRAVQRRLGKDQQAKTLRVREERALVRRYGAGPGPDASAAEQALFRQRVLSSEHSRTEEAPPTHAVTMFPHWAHATIWLGKSNEMRLDAPPPELVGTRLAIHAGARLADDWAQQLLAFAPAPDALRIGSKPGPQGSGPVATASLAGDAIDHPLRLGRIVGSARLAAVVAAGEGYAWILVDARPTKQTLLLKGQLGVWPLPASSTSALARD